MYLTLERSRRFLKESLKQGVGLRDHFVLFQRPPSFRRVDLALRDRARNFSQ
jgi:hypothetical protein